MKIKLYKVRAALHGKVFSNSGDKQQQKEKRKICLLYFRFAFFCKQNISEILYPENSIGFSAIKYIL